MKKTLALLFSSLILLAVSTSCNDKDNQLPENIMFDFATFVESNSNGTACEVQQLNDSPVAYLFFPNAKNLSTQAYKPGTRVYIAYSMDDNKFYTSGTGTLYGIAPIYNGVIKEGTAASTNQWKTMSQNIQSMWRTGKWINISTQCTYIDYNQLPKKFELVADTETLNDDYPVVYLIYEPAESKDANTKSFDASINIESVWDLPNVKGIKLKYVSNMEGEEYTFEKY